MVHIAELYVYPVKACRGIAVDEWTLEAAGLAYDREWMFVTPEGRFLTQREWPRLALVVPHLRDDRLELCAPGQEDLVVPFTATGERREVVVWRDRCAADWVSPQRTRKTRGADRADRGLCDRSVQGVAWRARLV